MLRRLTHFVAVVAACCGASAAVAQEATTKAISAAPKARLASYSAQYSNGGCVSCSQGASNSFAYGNGTGGPAAMAYGSVWGGAQGSRDAARFYHYPYVYYPQNFMGNEYFRSADDMYHRYPPEMQIPVYNRHWHNFYPSNRRYHSGHHFILDVF